MKHNKKRNVGIIYELLLNYVSRSLIEGNKKEAKKASNIIERHFRKGTELYKEFKLFNALANSNITNTHVVASILNEAKLAAKNKINTSKLEKEKSSLIKSINYNLDKNSFYHSNIKNYRDLGTVQLTLNEWRRQDHDLTKLALLESKVAEKMLKESPSDESLENVDVNHTNRLVYKIMIEKFNKQYNNNLNSDQKSIIKNYVFYNDTDKQKLQEVFKQKKNQCMRLLNEFEDRSNNKYLLSKVDNVRSKVDSISTTSINDASVVKFLTLTKLIEEITKGE
jgi:hypothetical protein